MLQRGTCAQALVRTMVPWYPYGDAELVRGHRPSVVEFSHILREIPNEALSLSLSPLSDQRSVCVPVVL